MSDREQKLDYKQTHQFWEERAKKFPQDPLMSVMLHDDIPSIARYRDITEKRHFLRAVQLSAGMEVLDLGGGNGRWALEIAGHVKRVTLVDFSTKLLEIAKRRSEEKGISNVDFECADIIHYESSRQYDLILLSGVLMYINDDDVDTICQHCSAMLKPLGTLVLREGVSWKGREIQPDFFSPELQARYHVLWRDPTEYEHVFGREFHLRYVNDAFPAMISVFFLGLFWGKKALSQGRKKALLDRFLMWEQHLDQLLLYKPIVAFYHRMIRRHRLAISTRLYIFSKKMASKSSFSFAGRDMAEFARGLETPFFVFSEAQIQANYARLMKGFSDACKPRIYYSVKTNYESGVLLTMKKYGLGAEIAGELDLAAAQKAGFQASEMIVDGKVKDPCFLEHVIQLGVKTINMDSLDEADTISAIAAKSGKKVAVGVRLDIDGFWGDWRNVLTDRRQKRFGVSPGQLLERADRLDTKHLCLTTLMTHTRKSFVVPSDYVYMLQQLFSCAHHLKQKGIVVEEFNLGGGIPEITPQAPDVLERFSFCINREYNRLSAQYEFSPRLSLELGKSLVGNSGILVGRVVRVEQGWIVTDISRSDYGFSFPFRKRQMVLVNKMNMPLRRPIGVCSNNLEKFDVIDKAARLPEAAPGDVVALLNVGAYSLPLSTQFTRPRSAVYWVTAQGKDVIIRRKESTEDVLSQQKWDME